MGNSLPTLNFGGAEVTDMLLTENWALAITDGGTADAQLWAWGSNGKGTVRQNSLLDNGLCSPEKLFPGPSFGYPVKIDGNKDDACVVSSTGLLKCWGSNTNGALVRTCGASKCPLNGDNTPLMNLGTGFMVSSISVSRTTLTAFIAVSPAGKVRTWGWMTRDCGRNYWTTEEYLGDGVNEVGDWFRDANTEGHIVSTTNNGVAVVAIMKGGEVYAWGGTNMYQSGFPSAINWWQAWSTSFQLPVPVVVADRQCIPCTELNPCPCTVGSYFDMGVVQCTQCTTNCSLGYYEEEPCTAMADSVCTKCMSGYTCNGFETTQCPADTWCVDGVHVNECPINQTSEPGSAFCECEVGLLAVTNVTCQTCPPGSTCIHGIATQCLENTWCVNSVQTACTENAVSMPGSSLLTDCMCIPGYFFNDLRECIQCPGGSWCAGSIQTVCPSGLPASLSGSTHGDNCTCVQGYYEGDTGSCTLCPSGSWCSNGIKTRCPVLAPVAPPGTSSYYECGCEFGTMPAPLCPSDYFEYDGYCYKWRTYDYLGNHLSACAAAGEGFTVARMYSVVQMRTLRSMVSGCIYGTGNPNPKCEIMVNMYYSGGTLKWRGSDDLVDFNALGPGCFWSARDNNYAFMFANLWDCGIIDIKSSDSRPSYCQGPLRTDPECRSCTVGHLCNGTSAVPCPAGSWCTGGVNRNSCPMNSMSIAGGSSIADCHCVPGYFGASGDCTICPPNMWCRDGVVHECPDTFSSLPGASNISHCVCAPGYALELGLCEKQPSPCLAGSYGLAGLPCTLCEKGFYCPGGEERHRCPWGLLTSPILGATGVSNCKQAICGNFILESGEQCDNGAPGGDGCSNNCQFEDSCGCANGTEWVCKNTPLETTDCCPSLTNPVTGQFVCSCDGYRNTIPGAIITSGCVTQDIDECRTNNGGCSVNAVCTNMNVLEGNITHVCTCPPGMVGDGVSRCDIYVYQVKFTVSVYGSSIDVVNSDNIKQRFIDNGVVPAWVSLEDITLHIVSSTSGARRLLQGSGMEITAVIETDSPEDMAETMEGINTDIAISEVAESLGGNVVVLVSEPPSSEVLTIDVAFGAVSTFPTGFNVDSVRYDHVKWEWIIRARYARDDNNVLTSMYLSKTGPKPYSQSVKNTYSISTHPCMKTLSVCCLYEYKDQYVIGSLASNITTELSVCSEGNPQTYTTSMFDTTQNQHLIENMLSAYPESYVERINANVVDIHLYRNDLRDSFSMVTDITGGYTMDFFVGISYYTLLPAPAISTVASQVKISATVSDVVTFSTTSQQDYTFLQYITLAIFDTKLIQNFANEYHPQTVRVGFVIPAELTQNMRTGLVPVTSVRFSISRSLPDLDNAGAWTNPCFSTTGTGLWDPLFGFDFNPLLSLYEDAQAQGCFHQYKMCTNPMNQVLDSRLIEFWFPIGNDIINSTIINSETQYSIYVYFDVNLIDKFGKRVQTKLFAQAPLTGTSVSMMCQSLSSASTLEDVMDVSIAVGMVGVQEEWDPTIYTVNHILSQPNALLDLNVETTPPSIQNGLITVVLHGEDDPFSDAITSAYHLEIDDMVTFHFLDDDIYTEVLSLIANGLAWTLEPNADTGYMEIQVTNQMVSRCISYSLPGDMSCVIRRDISARTVPQEYTVHPLATGVGTHDITSTSRWVQKHLLGYSEYADEMARNFTQLVRGKYAINDRYKKAWFVNPGYPWSAREGSAAQSILGLSSRTILVAVLTLDDGTGSSRRRMLLQVDSGSQGTSSNVQNIVNHPVPKMMPNIKNVNVDPMVQMAKAVGVETNFGFTKVQMQITAREDATDLEIRDTVQGLLQMQIKDLSVDATNAWVVQYKLKKNTVDGRRLLTDLPTFEGDILILFNFSSANVTVDTAELRETIQTMIGNITLGQNLTLSEQYNLISSVVVQKLELLQPANELYAGAWARIVDKYVNDVAEELGMSTPNPNPYPPSTPPASSPVSTPTEDEFSSMARGCVSPVWIILALHALLASCYVVVL